jgi:hypothetical protein
VTLRARRLTTLRLGANALGDAGAASLAAALCPRRAPCVLQELRLSENGLGPAGTGQMQNSWTFWLLTYRKAMYPLKYPSYRVLSPFMKCYRAKTLYGVYPPASSIGGIWVRPIPISEGVG